MRYAGVELREHEGNYYFDDLTLASEHDRRGPNLHLREAFIQKHSLRESKSRAFPKWLVLLPKGMRHIQSYFRHNEGPEEAHKIMERVDDHYYLFVRNGKYVYTTQPYNLHLEKYKAVEDYWRGLGLFVDISIKDAWWYPGRAPLIVIAQEPLELS